MASRLQQSGTMEQTTAHSQFNGADYVPARDNTRLMNQCLRVFAAISDHAWHTLPQLAEITGDPPASISAQLRHLRKPRFGGHIISRRYIANGLYEYKLGMAE